MTDNNSSHNSKDYDKSILKTIPYYDCFHNETINLVKSIFRNSNSWLDTGCGTGNLIKKALTEFPDFQFYLADPSIEMLKVCEKKFSNHQVEILGNYDTIGLNINFNVDIITAIQCHHYLNKKNREAATQKCYDLLNFDGLYVTFENIKYDSPFGIENGLQRWGNFQLEMGRSKYDVQKHKYRFDNDYFPITISEHLALMHQAGFRIVELFWMTTMQAGFYGIK